MNFHVRKDKGKSERAEGHETLHTAGDPTGYWCSATNLHVKLSSVFEHTHTHTHSVEQSFLHMHSNDDDDDDNFDGDDDDNNNFNSF